MKNKENHIDELKGLPKEMTKENLHLYPKDIQEAFLFFEKNKETIFFKEKYFAVQKNVLLRSTKELFEKSPDLTPKQVLLNIMQTLPDFLPADNLIEVTKIITTTWEELQQKVAA